MIKRILIAVPAAAVGLYIALVIVNTMFPDKIAILKDNSLFVFNQNWGYGRGIAWQTGGELLGRMSLPQKLLGVGPDCFREYLYGFGDLAQEIKIYYNGSILTNAHNEWITMLVNQGILGTMAYAGIFVSMINRFMKAAKHHQLLYLPTACAFSYIVHNMVSFGQILNMPFLILIIGIGESCYRQLKQKFN